MSSPSVIVFDLGKVLLDFDYAIAAGRIAAASSRSRAEVQALIDQSPLLHRFEMGQVTEETFFEQIQRETGFRGDFAQFKPLFADIFVPIPAMVELHERIRHHRATYILSNTNSLAVDQIRRQFDFFRRFDGYIFSYEHGAMKPDIALYQVVEKISGKEGEQILFVDDRPDNVAAANERGWKTIWHQSPKTTALAMREQGVV